MNRMTSVIKLQYADKWTWAAVPVMIMLMSFTVNYIISFYVPEDIYTGGISSIFVYMLIVGAISPVQMFPFALGFGLRRTDFFLGTAATVLLNSAAVALFLLAFSFTESHLTGGWGTHLHYFHLPYLNNGSALQQLWIYFSMMVHMYFLGFVISCIGRRYGRTGMLTLSLAGLLLLPIIGFIISKYAGWSAIFSWFGLHTAFELALMLFPLTCLYALCSFLLLRRATV